MQPINFELRDLEETMSTLILTVAIAALAFSTSAAEEEETGTFKLISSREDRRKPVRFWTRGASTLWLHNL